jgi:hypothetical protein
VSRRPLPVQPGKPCNRGTPAAASLPPPVCRRQPSLTTLCSPSPAVCGIFGYANYRVPRSQRELIECLLTGLRRLEYRGYDSAGVAFDLHPPPSNGGAGGATNGAAGSQGAPPCLPARPQPRHPRVPAALTSRRPPPTTRPQRHRPALAAPPASPPAGPHVIKSTGKIADLEKQVHSELGQMQVGAALQRWAVAA